jgi:hypothetical protein
VTPPTPRNLLTTASVHPVPLSGGQRPRTDSRTPTDEPGRPGTCHLSSHAGGPRSATGDGRKPVRPPRVDSGIESQPAAPEPNLDQPEVADRDRGCH